MSDVDAYPLAWPAGRPRTSRRKRSNFKVSMAGARGALLEELRMLGAKNVVISTNVQLRRDGLPYATQKTLDDPGVAVYFDLYGSQKCFSCDRWSRVWDNVRAIEKTINAMRGIERWGSGDMVAAAFAGFDALPAGGGTHTVDAWWNVLGVERDASDRDVRGAYLEKVRRHHPDSGGDNDMFLRIKSAFEQARNERGRL